MRRNHITDEQRRYVAEHFDKESNARLKAATGLSLPSIYRIANEAGVSRTRAFRCKLQGGLDIPDDKMDWFIKHFKDTENFVLADRLGISESSLHRLARRFGLKKSRAFMQRAQQEATKMSKYSHVKFGTGAKKGVYSDNLRKGEAYQFKPGISNRMRNGAVNERHRVISSVISRRETVRKERARVKAGLPQLTKLHVKCEPKGMAQIRFYLKKCGYILDEEKSVAYWNDGTRRAVRLEARQDYPYSFQPSTDD